MNLAEFQNALRILRAIDLHDMNAAGVMCSADARLNNQHWQEWCRFRDNPSMFFLCCDDDTAKTIWTMIERRQQPMFVVTEAHRIDDEAAP